MVMYEYDSIKSVIKVSILLNSKRRSNKKTGSSFDELFFYFLYLFMRQQS
jgi:hypothetical protein